MKNATPTLRYFASAAISLLLTGAVSPNARAATPVLVKDINPSPPPFEGYPGPGVFVASEFFFGASDTAHGYELWKGDGTPSGSALLKDINPGSGDSFAGAGTGGILNLNGVVYFLANDGTSGFELWKSDGTEQGTVLVKDINPGGGSSIPQNLTEVNGTLFFAANDGASGAEMWKSDGTADGTVLVKDINPGSAGSFAQDFMCVDGIVYFRASDGVNDFEPWRSDGTAEGTFMLKDISSIGSSQPGEFTDFNGTLLFRANADLWKSDGTTEGTVLVKSVSPGLNPNFLTVVNGTLFFSATDVTNGHELWKSDGTEQGTMLVKDIRNGFDSSSPGVLAVLNGELFFRATISLGQHELWKSDGTDQGTVRVKAVAPGGADGCKRDALFQS